MIVSKFGKSYDTADGSEVPHQKTEASKKPQDSDEAADERLSNEGAPVFTAPFEFIEAPKPSWSVLSRHDLDLADRWFAKYGEIIVFVSRLLPAIRTFIAFPAGVARMNLPRFIIYTFAGSLPWCLGLAYVGQKLGEQWDKDDTLKTWFHRFDFLIGIAGLLFIIWWVWRHIKHSRPHPENPR